MKIALLGWGSLIWDKRPEFDKYHEKWKDGGPSLNLEFSRISDSRDGALTLVIDEKNGEECRVKYAISKRLDPNDTVCDLRSREGTILKNIGYYFRDENQHEPCKLNVPKSIKTWAVREKINVIVWTGLSSNFGTKTYKAKKVLFSIEEAILYLHTLTPKGKTMAAEYVWRAPSFVDTPLRRALELEPWFTNTTNE